MRATMAAAAALAGGLFLLATAHGPASAMSAPINLKNIIGTIPGSVELAGHGGGGGGGGHSGGGGGPRVGNGPRGGGNFANRSGGRNYSGPHSYAGRNFDRSPRASRNYSGDRGRYADHNRGDHRRYAERGRDNNHNNHNNRHRVFRNGAWVWIYGPDYYYDDYAYGGDCYWLRQQAYATGSPYWWSRYNACVGYY